VAGGVRHQGPVGGAQQEGVAGNTRAAGPAAGRDGWGVGACERRVHRVTAIEPYALLRERPQVGGHLGRGKVRAQTVPNHDTRSLGPERRGLHQCPRNAPSSHSATTVGTTLASSTRPGVPPDASQLDTTSRSATVRMVAPRKPTARPIAAKSESG